MNFNIRAIRHNQCLTQEAVALKAGISRATYTNIENGIRKPSVNMAKRIAEVLGFDWTKFYE